MTCRATTIIFKNYGHPCSALNSLTTTQHVQEVHQHHSRRRLRQDLDRVQLSRRAMVLDPLLAKMSSQEDDNAAALAKKKAKKERKALAKKEKAASLNTSKDENTDTSPTAAAKDEKKPAANNSVDGVFDVRKLMEELKAENAFVSKALSLVHIPKHKNQESHGKKPSDNIRGGSISTTQYCTIPQASLHQKKSLWLSH